MLMSIKPESGSVVHGVVLGICITVLPLPGCRSGSESAAVEALLAEQHGAPPRPVERALDSARAEVEAPVLDETSGLNDYLAYAALRNAGLEAAFNRWRAAVERVPQVQALPDPRLTYRYFIREVETRVGPQKQSVGLTQMFPWFGELQLRADAAAEAARAELRRYQALKLALFYEVKEAYYEYYYLGRAIEVVGENLELIGYLERVARARYKTAAASHPDVIRAQVELGRLEDQLHGLQDLRGSMVARLNAAMNRAPAAELPFPRAVPDEQLDGDDAIVLELLAEHNPELRALDHKIAQSEAEIALARKEYYPDLTLGVDYTDVGQPPRPPAAGIRNAGAVRSAARIAGGAGDLIDAYALGRGFLLGERPDDAGQDVWSVSLSMNIPVWHEKYAAGEREARFRKMSATAERRQRRNDLSAAVKRTLYEYRDAQRKIVLYRDTLIVKAREAIASTETAFRAGQASFLELVDAERSLLEFELSYERALSDRGTRLAQLDLLAGTTLPRSNASTDAAP